MIFVEGEQEFVMVTQDDHARVSGQIAQALPNAWFASEKDRREVVFAVQEHDRGWIDLDHTPIWNDGKQVPFSFMDYPLRPKLAFYKKGVDEVEAESGLAALLCSRYYVSFFTEGEMQQPEEALRYVEEERKRQQRILNELGLETEQERKTLDLYYLMMQFCDNASLYLCLNHPGARKDEEFPWYRQGFKQRFGSLNHEIIMPEWLSKDEVRLTPFPLSEEITVQLKVKRVNKAKIKQMGLAHAYAQTGIETRKIQFVQN